MITIDLVVKRKFPEIHSGNGKTAFSLSKLLLGVMIKKSSIILDQHPTLLKEYLGKRVSIETMIILDELVEFSKKWDKDLVWDDFVWPDVKKLMKNYKGFLTIDAERYRMKLLKLIEESS